ncbi:hypothetical protein RXV95_12755 [Novosphingobium sp. ZN18A2]|uniref:hypothetical protein n=1 Tax=Novosphingobium sp. ZN18A2 TaxID=3079861 RepID=UPI0030CB3D35
MNLLKLAASAALATAMLPAASAYAQAAAPQLTAGTTVYDPQGGEVGTIVSSAGGNVVIDTGANKATIPGAAVTKGDKGPQIAYTKAQLDAAIQAAAGQAQAKLQQSLVPGTLVYGKGGAMVGAVKEVKDTQVVVTRPGNVLVALPKSAFTVGAQGLQISMTSAQLDTQLQAAAPATPEADATASADAGAAASNDAGAGTDAAAQ